MFIYCLLPYKDSYNVKSEGNNSTPLEGIEPGDLGINLFEESTVDDCFGVDDCLLLSVF